MLYDFQQKILEDSEGKNRVAYYLEMGLGKTFVGSEKMRELGAAVNILVCQKSKIADWKEHFEEQYSDLYVCDLTTRNGYEEFFDLVENRLPRGCWQIVGIVNYDLIWRRKAFLTLRGYTLMLDESSLIQNDTAKKTKFILKMRFKNVILLSGTPVSGRYEKLYSQCRLLGWGISKKLYWNQYIETELMDLHNGIKIPKVVGYKNVDRLKTKLRFYGAFFMKSDEVLDLPEQVFIEKKISPPKEYAKFMKDSIAEVSGTQFVGNTNLKKLLYARQICGMVNENKYSAFEDLLNSNEKRLIVFYNFDEELRRLQEICSKNNRPVSVINGKSKDLTSYEECLDSVTLIQYQAGAMGLNLQKANTIVYFSLNLSSDLFEQSKKRIHRIGQKNRCFYYVLVSGVETKIYESLKRRKDYTDELFRKDYA